MTRWNEDAHPWQRPRPMPRAVIATLHVGNYKAPSHVPPGTYHATDGRVTTNDGRIAGRIVSNITIRPDGLAEALLIVTLDDEELDHAFPHGYVIDPTFEEPTP